MAISIPEILSLADTYLRELPPVPTEFSPPDGHELAGWLDHTLLKPEATAGQIEKLCKEALEYNFATVCVNPVFVPLAHGLLRDSNVGVCSVIAFPLGANLPEYKLAESNGAIKLGATEIDMVINLGALKGEAYKMVLHDIETVVQAAHLQEVKVKVIIETALLSKYEKIVACLLSKEAGADFVKTATGFGPGGATVEDVSLMRRIVGAEMGVKASVGIRSLEDAQAMIVAGANRLGSSACVQIIETALN